MKAIWVILFLLLIGILLAAEMIREYHHFKVTKYSLYPEQTKRAEEDVKIIFLSDLHNRVYDRNNDHLFYAIKKEKPDLILIGGDMIVDKKNGTLHPASDFVCRLPEICPVFYANGNHEQRLKEMPEKYDISYIEYKEELERHGIVFLENGSQDVSIKGVFFRLYGLELSLDTYRKFIKEKVVRDDIAKRLGEMKCRTEVQAKVGRETAEEHASASDFYGEESCFHILLAHNPTYVEAYKSWGADLILCGHLHGGLVRLPLIGGVITPQAFLFPKYSGEMRTENGQTVIVSKGLGSHTINIRLFNMPEVVSIELKRSCKM